MTAEVFESAATDQGEDALGIRNTLSIESLKFFDDPTGAMVVVDTNYKSTRTSDYPVNLTLPDSVKAASAFLREVRAGYDRTNGDNPQLAWELLSELLTLDGDLQHLRELLVSDLDPSARDEA